MGLVIESGWKRVGRQVLDVLYPPLCIACREHVSEPDSLCPECWRTLHFLDGPVCAACGLPFEIDPGGEMLCAGCLAHPPSFDKARAVLRYDDSSRKPILALKNMDRLDLAPAFGRWLERAGRELLAQSDLIVPVPLHRYRLWKRRYNQSAELARALSRLGGMPVDTFALRRVRSTPSQAQMPSASARRRNVRGAFAVPEKRRSEVDGKHIR